MSGPAVGIVVASRAEQPVVDGVIKLLEELGVGYVQDVLSPHLNPSELAEWASGAEDAGRRVLIAASTLGASLAGAVAAHTTLPVVGLPCSSVHLSAADALFATAQMPKGVPVATVGVDAAENAALLAVQILATADRELAGAVSRYREEQARENGDHREWDGGEKPRRFGFGT